MVLTVKANQERIIHLEDDVKELNGRVTNLETNMTDLLARLDIIIKMGRVTLIIVASALGLDVGIEGGMF
ncbi:MAG: hypothetical protein GY777_27780 [Candidatus Brocadiaceae bacterium]|jgi:hypothetical protein|nr:hypothetical protein [Candidatus Brocadiaceae bacterium]